MKCILIYITAITLSACASAPPPPPAWTESGARSVDNGYIVYVAKSTASTEERAQFKAEGLALQDLANECSLVPVGTRVEDRHLHREKYEVTAYVKVALEFQECEQARRVNDPSDIRKLASVSFTQQLKRYQDLEETGELPSRDEVAELAPPAELPPAPVRQAGWDDSTHLYVMRQYVAYQKEVVVLAPPTTYAPGSPANQQFASAVAPSAEHINTIEAKDPGLRKSTWSQVPNQSALRPQIRPQALAPRSTGGFNGAGSHSVRPPSAMTHGSPKSGSSNPSAHSGSSAPGQRRGRRGRRGPRP